MIAPHVIERCRTRWRSIEPGDDLAWHMCADHNDNHLHAHHCACGATCPVLGITPSSAEGTPTA